jgi:selenocysteine lyase/cysteine desulfurase
MNDATLSGGDAIAVSAVQYGSGFTFDLGALAKHANARRVPLAVNVAQALGQVPVSTEGIDFLCGVSHKWMMGGYGVGLLFVREGWLEEHGLPWAGWLSAPDSLRWQNFPGSSWEGPVASGAQLRHDASALEAGCGPWSVLQGFSAGLDLVRNAGVARIHAHNLELQKHLREGLQRRGFSPNAPLMSGICVTRVEGNPQEVVRGLLKHQVVVTPRAGGIRFSTHIYNNHDDVDRALRAFDLLRLKPASAV